MMIGSNETSDLQVHAPSFVPRWKNEGSNNNNNNNNTTPTVSSSPLSLCLTDIGTLIGNSPPLMPITSKSSSFFGLLSRPDSNFEFPVATPTTTTNTAPGPPCKEKPQRLSRFTGMFNNIANDPLNFPPPLLPVSYATCSSLPSNFLGAVVSSSADEAEVQLQEPYPCAGCKLNWMTGTSKEHDCTFTDQYVSSTVKRADFQTALPRTLQWLVDIFSTLTHQYSLVSVSMTIGVTHEMLMKAKSQCFKTFRDQAYYVFFNWMLNRLEGGATEKNIVVNLVHDLCESGKTDLVLLIWSKDNFNFI